MSERKQFTFYESFFAALGRIEDKRDRADAYDAICAYALTGAEPDFTTLSPIAAMAFDLIKPVLESANKKAASGRKGGSKAKAKSSVLASSSKQITSDKEGEKESDIEGEVEIEKENESYLEKENLEKKKPSRFSPPSLAEVAAYVAERGSIVDPQAFIDFYASKGWMVGKNPMKDWRAACRNAENWEHFSGPPKKQRASPGGNPFVDMLREEDAI